MFYDHTHYYVYRLCSVRPLYAPSAPDGNKQRKREWGETVNDSISCAPSLNFTKSRLEKNNKWNSIQSTDLSHFVLFQCGETPLDNRGHMRGFRSSDWSDIGKRKADCYSYNDASMISLLFAHFPKSKKGLCSRSCKSMFKHNIHK